MTRPSGTEAVFFAALEKSTAGERAAFLDDACAGNEDLRRKVERLLDSHARAGGFLERPVREVEAVAAGAPPAGGAAGDAGAGSPGADLALDFLAPSARPDALGRLGHYEVLQVIGSGGMGVVLRAFDDKLHRVVAIKVLAPTLAAVGPARRRFVREARTAASVIHDNVIAVHGVEDDGPVPYLVMQYVSGPTLQQKIDQAAPLPVVEVLRVGMQIASGLAAAHRQGIVHRDVKPSNVLMENGVERVKLSDFGLARAVDDPGGTNPGMIAGTPAYMSPEQADGRPVDHRSDLFSFGSVLYAMCTGYAPFRSTSMMAVMKRVCDSTAPPVREVNPDVPDWLEELVSRLHAKDPAARPGSAAEVAEELGRRLADLQQPARAAAPREARRPAAGPPRRLAYRWPVAVAVVALLAAGLGTAEATGVTALRGAVVRLFHPDGTLVVEVDDPAVSVSVEGSDVVVTGAGVKEIRLKPGEYTVQATRDGKVVRQELVSVARAGRRVVRISKESAPAAEPRPNAPWSREETERWEQAVAAMPADDQVRAVSARLKELNPGFDGVVFPIVDAGAVVGLRFPTTAVADVTPVRSLPKLRMLDCNNSGPGKLTDLGPLRGLRLEHLRVQWNPVADLGPVQDLPLQILDCGWSQVTDLSPLAGKSLTELRVQATGVSDLSVLRGMPLKRLDLHRAREVRDIGPLKGMPLEYLNLTGLPLTDVSQLAEYKALRWLVLDEMPVTDLSPLRGLAVDNLNVRTTPVTNFDPIRGLPLKRLRLDYRPERRELLRSFPNLESINDRPAAEFWKSVGER